jgi:hypothetical protein
VVRTREGARPLKVYSEGKVRRMAISDGERELNLAARLLPQRRGDDELPCLEVGGVQVYVYFEGGELRVSVHYDGADAAVVTEAGTVPTRVSLGDLVAYGIG